VGHPTCPTASPRETLAHRHDHGRRETLGTDPVSGKVREIMHLPGNSWLPLVIALGLAVVCIALLARSYTVALHSPRWPAWLSSCAGLGERPASRRAWRARAPSRATRRCTRTPSTAPACGAW
jgi:hypothetical protein